MSSREEEDRRKNNCTNRGLGLAAAAIGVGVGAALLYLFTKREEQPSAEGSTSSNWSCEAPQAFYTTHQYNKTKSDQMEVDSDSEYSTVSEHSTSDTSVHDSSYYSTDSSLSIETISENDAQSDDEDTTMDSDTDSNQSDMYIVNDDTEEESDLDESEWDIPTDSFNTDNVFENRASRLDFMQSVRDLIGPRGEGKHVTEQERLNRMRDQKFRTRTWSLEECSICCDVMLNDQDLSCLPCTHRFHKACIQPWLSMDEQQTCPNCRKQAV